MRARKFVESTLLYCLVAAMVIMGYYIFKKEHRTNVCFVNIGKLVEDYQFRKDLEQTSAGNLNRLKGMMDSLKMVRRLNARPVSALDTQMANIDRAFNQYYKQSNVEISQKIWERLNPLLEQYGKEKNIEIIIGASGTGTVLYGSPKNDITDNVIQYVNEKYSKGS